MQDGKKERASRAWKVPLINYIPRGAICQLYTKYSICYIVHNKHIVYNISRGKCTEEGEGMLAKVIATTMLLTAVICVIKRKRDRERRRLQEEELAFFLSLGAGGGYSWQNVGKHRAAASSDSVPVIHTQIDGSAQAPDRENLAPGETWSRRYRFR